MSKDSVEGWVFGYRWCAIWLCVYLYIELDEGEPICSLPCSELWPKEYDNGVSDMWTNTNSSIPEED